MKRISLEDFFGTIGSGALLGALLALGLLWVSVPSEVTPEFHWKEEVFITGGFYKGQEGVVERVTDELVKVSFSGEEKHYTPHGAWFTVDIGACNVIVHKDHLLRKQSARKYGVLRD
jgi:hypothetical protein